MWPILRQDDQKYESSPSGDGVPLTGKSDPLIGNGTPLLRCGSRSARENGTHPATTSSTCAAMRARHSGGRRGIAWNGPGRRDGRLSFPDHSQDPSCADRDQARNGTITIVSLLEGVHHV